MNEPADQTGAGDMCRDLREYHTLCEEVLALDSRENQALSSGADYQPFEFYQSRKNLLSRLHNSLTLLRKWRVIWQQTSPSDRLQQAEVRAMLQTVQSILVKVLVLERENQQSLLHRGLLPPQHLPPPGGQQPGFVANLYQRHASS